MDNLHGVQMFNASSDLAYCLFVVQRHRQFRMCLRRLYEISQRRLTQVESDEEEVVSSFLTVV